MHINTIKFRQNADQPWQGFRLTSGTGKFRNYQVLKAKSESIEVIAEAILSCLGYKKTARLLETQMQLSDDAGNTWGIYRRPGEVRYVKNGERMSELEAAPQNLLAALLDLDSIDYIQKETPALHIGHYAITTNPAHGLGVQSIDQVNSPHHMLKNMLHKQMEELASEVAQKTEIKALANPSTLARLGRRLEVLSIQGRELARQYKELCPETETSTEIDLKELIRLNSEVEMMDEIAAVAEPLLVPGVSLGIVKDALAKAEIEITDLCQQLGLEAPPNAAQQRDWRKPLDVLANLEAYAKLLRSSQGVMKLCEQKVRPIYEEYLKIAESNLASDQQLTMELESCIATLELKMHEAQPNKPVQDSAAKSWFERFKARAFDEPRLDASTEADQNQESEASKLETARMAAEYALSRLNELKSGLGDARAEAAQAFEALHQTQAELAKHHASLKKQWSMISQQMELPEKLDLPQLLAIIQNYSRLTALWETRFELKEKAHLLSGRLTKLQSLIANWRKITGSQKLTDLDNPAILLTEARDIVRYREAKTSRLTQLKNKSSEAEVISTLRANLQTRRRHFLQEWNKAHEEFGIPPIAFNHPALSALLRNANLLGALALVHSSALKDEHTQLFDSSTENSAASLFVWASPAVEHKHRMELLTRLEETAGGELRLLLLADETLAAMLGALGVGQASELKIIPEPDRPSKENASPAPSKAPVDPLNDRARRALDMLTGRKTI